MSLVLAGYDYEMFYDKKIDDGIFAISDSAITSHQGGRTILNGFRKVYELEAKIWKPSFTMNGDLIWRYFLGHKIVIQPLIFVAGFTNEKLVTNRAELLNILKKVQVAYIGATGQ